MFYIVCDSYPCPALCLLLACLIDGIEDLLAELLKLFLRVRTEVEADLCHRNDRMDSSKLPACMVVTANVVIGSFGTWISEIFAIARPAAWIGFATFAKAPQACPPMPWKLISYVWIPVAS